jgi:branched-chain amino acid transport system permease protein
VATACAWAIAVLGVNLVAGFAGRVALGQGAFVGTGAYCAVILSADHGWPIALTVPAAGVVGAALGIVIGMPALRITGLHLALVTLSVGAAFGPVVKRLESITGGANGKGSPASWVAPTWLGEGRDADARWWYVLVATCTIACFAMTWNVMRGRVGRAIIAVRDDELASRVNGIDVGRTLLGAFGGAAALASVAGALLVARAPFASPANYELGLSLQLFATASLGGMRSIRGAAIGGAASVALPDLLRRLGVEIDGGIVFGLLLIVTVVVAPDGLAGGRRRRQPDRSGITTIATDSCRSASNGSTVITDA